MSAPASEHDADALWRFALDLYPQPGVEQACLRLQDDAGADVNLVMLALWLGLAGVVPDEPAAMRLREISRAWQDEVLAPMRRVRRRLKQASPALVPPEREEAIAAWRRALLAHELQAEKLEQSALLATLPGDIAPRGAASPTESCRLALACLLRLPASHAQTLELLVQKAIALDR